MCPLLLRTQGTWFNRALNFQIARGALIAIATLFLFAGLTYLPLADAFAIYFVEPLLVTLLSDFVFKDGISWRKLSAVAVGFVGALIIIKPTFSEIGYPALFSVFSALYFSLYIVLTRHLVKSEDPIRIRFFSGIFGCLVMGIALFFGEHYDVEVFSFSSPTKFHWMLLVAKGLTDAVVHLLVTYAYKVASIGELAPFQYIEIIGATILGFMIFGDFSDLVTWLGIARIVGSGMYVFHREAKVAKEIDNCRVVCSITSP